LGAQFLLPQQVAALAAPLAHKAVQMEDRAVVVAMMETQPRLLVAQELPGRDLLELTLAGNKSVLLQAVVEALVKHQRSL
jgi:hypothetical protein